MRRPSVAADVLRIVLDHGPVARSTIGCLTGLSAAAVNRRCADLADLGLLRERPLRVPRSTIGRPHVPVDIDTRRHTMEGWFRSGAADGFNVMPPYYPGGLETFTATVVPILRERGLFREGYTGSTLREHLGLARPASRFSRPLVRA